MFKKFFKKEKNENIDNKNILIAALLIRAAKMDENYTNIEKEIIKKSLINLNNISPDQAETLVLQAEKKEADSNQLIEFTKEIKKYSMEYRLKIIEVIWKIVYSDGISDSYETSMIRRVCGLLYISDKDNGIVKKKVQDFLENK